MKGRIEGAAVINRENRLTAPRVNVSGRSLDILMISYWDFQDEGMQVIKKTVIHFAQQGHKVTFLVHSENTAKPSPHEFLHPNLRIVRFEMPLKWMNQFRVLRRPRQFILFAACCFWTVAKTYRKGSKPQLIYAAEADAVLIGALLKRFYRVPLVTRFYGISRISAYFDFHSRTLKPMGIRNYFSKLAITRRADMIIVTDDGSRGLDVIKAVNPSVKNVRFWRNGIDKPTTEQAHIQRLRDVYGIGDHDFVLLTLCRLDRWKGVDRALRALRHVVESGVKNVKLLVAGHGPELDFLKRLATEFCLNKHISFTGAIPHSDVYLYYSLADVFLSLYRISNVGNPLWEALNAGCCIITLDTGATGDVISDGINGRLLPYDTNESTLAREIGEAISRLYSDPQARKELSQGALDYAARCLWTWDERLAAEMHAIEGILNAYIF